MASREAEAVQVEAQSVLEQYKAQLAEARHEAARLRQEAQEQGAALITEMRAEGQRQREEIVAAGHAQIEADRKAAASALRRTSATRRPSWPASSSASPSRTTPGRAASSTVSSTTLRRGRGRGAMNGASREALAAARERLDALTDSTSVDARSSPTSWPPSPRCSTARCRCVGS